MEHPDAAVRGGQLSHGIMRRVRSNICKELQIFLFHLNIYGYEIILTVAQACFLLALSGVLHVLVLCVWSSRASL